MPARRELWLKIHKKGSGLPTVTNAQALDVALCWGWIDGIRKSLDEQSFLQRYTPRRARSVWSQINRDHVARLTAAGRMTPHGQRQVDAAKADGRWDAAYAPIRSANQATIPEDLRAAIEANPRAAQDLPHARSSEPVRAGVSHQQHENASRAREEDRGAGRHARARRDHRPGTSASGRRLQIRSYREPSRPQTNTGNGSSCTSPRCRAFNQLRIVDSVVSIRARQGFAWAGRIRNQSWMGDLCVDLPFRR